MKIFIRFSIFILFTIEVVVVVKATQCQEDQIKYPLPRHLPFAYTPPHFEIQSSDVIYVYSVNSETSPNPDYKCVKEETGGNSVCSQRNNYLKVDKQTFDNLTEIKENLKVNFPL